MVFYSIRVTYLQVPVRPTSLLALNCYRSISYLVKALYKELVWCFTILHGFQYDTFV
jgi:hypothetical protein